MSDIMSSPGEPMRQHEVAAMRDERDAALAENKRLRELYENAVGNRERFGWTINHLLECEDTLAHFQAEAASFERERDEACRQLADALAAKERAEGQRDDLLEAIEAAWPFLPIPRPGDRIQALYDTAKKIRADA